MRLKIPNQACWCSPLQINLQIRFLIMISKWSNYVQMFASNINRQVCMLVCEYTLPTDKVPLPTSLEDRASYCCCWRERRTEAKEEGLLSFLSQEPLHVSVCACVRVCVCVYVCMIWGGGWESSCVFEISAPAYSCWPHLIASYSSPEGS